MSENTRRLWGLGSDQVFNTFLLGVGMAGAVRCWNVQFDREDKWTCWATLNIKKPRSSSVSPRISKLSFEAVILSWRGTGMDGKVVKYRQHLLLEGEGADVKCDLCEWRALGWDITHQHMPPFQEIHIIRLKKTTPQNEQGGLGVVLSRVSLKQIRLIASWAALVKSEASRARELILPSVWHLWDGIWSATSHFRLPSTGRLLICLSESSGGYWDGRGLESMMCEDMLGYLGLFSLEKGSDNRSSGAPFPTWTVIFTIRWHLISPSAALCCPSEQALSSQGPMQTKSCVSVSSPTSSLGNGC